VIEKLIILLKEKKRRVRGIPRLERRSKRKGEEKKKKGDECDASEVLFPSASVKKAGAVVGFL